MNVKYKTRSLTDLNCLYLLNVDKNFNQIIQKYGMFKNVFTIYQGHHYNSYLDFANLILPSKPAIQEEGSFINANGDVLHITDVLHDDNIFVKDNILILYSVFSTLFPTLKDNLKLVLTTKTFTSLNPALVNSKTISTLIVNYTLIKLKNNILKNYTLNTTLYKFYANDNISLASQLMSNCNKTLVKRFNY
jgi:NADH dehydrogenase/NADH:ubiquinone oxidoreductase subunit G